MNAKDLYNRMELDFCLSACDDDWSNMQINKYITPQYQKRYMGIVTDCTSKIDYVYTAVFPSSEVIGKILRDNRRNALLFLHHPMDWDINTPEVFLDVSPETFQEFKERNISIYNLHAPLDAIGRYSTSCSFAAALHIEMTGDFYNYHKVNIGVLGETKCKTLDELKTLFETAVGHNITLYQYGDNIIKGGKVALVAGGGNDEIIYPILRDMGINTYLTGIANMRTGYPPNVAGHKAAKDCGVSILAGTHYSTEKFALIKMVDYFNSLGIPGEFIPGHTCMEDM